LVASIEEISTRPALFAGASAQNNSALSSDDGLNGYSGCSRNSESDDRRDEECMVPLPFNRKSPPV